MTTAAIFTLATLSVLHTVLLLGIVRRLHSLTAARSAPSAEAAHTAALEPTHPLPGTKVRDFSAVSTTGERVGRADLTGRTLVGFFAMGCPLCQELAPRFARYASAHDGGRDRVLAVVAGTASAAAAYADQLGGVARVIVEPFEGPVCGAFDVDGFPCFALLADGVVLASAVKIEALRLPDPAHAP